MRSDRCDLSQAARCHMLPSVAYPAAFPTLHRVLSVKDRLVFKKHLADSHRDKSNSSTIFFSPQTIFFSPDFSIIRLQIWVFLRGCYAIKYYMFLIAIDLHFFTTQKVSPRPHQFSSTSLFFYGVLCASSNANEQH